MEKEEFEKILKVVYFQRKKDAIKNDFGKTLIYGGSRPYPNAPLISAAASSYTGVGFTALGIPLCIYPSLTSRAEETMIYEPSLSEEDLVYTDKELERMFSSYTSILFGNGLKDDENNLLLLKKILKGFKGNLIIDATGLSLYSKVEEDIRLKASPSYLLLTPHLGEASRLLSLDFHSRNPEDYLNKAKDFTSRYHVNILLKSVSSLFVTTDGKSYKSSYDPTPSLGKAGSGDGLAGYIAGLLANKDLSISPDELVIFADHFIHALAAYAETKESPAILDITRILPYLNSFVLSYR